MNVIISTVKRPNNSPYLDRLITSIRKDYRGVIHLVIGGNDTKYTDKYNGKLYKKHCIGEEEKIYKDSIQRAAYGYYRCLTIDRTTPCIIFEDDGELIDTWYTDLAVRIKYISDPIFVLSLIIPFKGAVPVPDIDLPSVQPFLYHTKLDYHTPGQLPLSTVSTYCNTTGVYYPVSLLSTRLPEYIKRFAVDDQTVHDLALGNYMFRYNFPVWITVPPLLNDVESLDSSLGAVKRRMHVDYSDWDYLKP